MTTELRQEAGSIPRRSRLSVSAQCAVASFGAYFCIYGLRKPFTAGTYADVTHAGVDYKTLLVVAQVLGYMLSKFIGIKVVAEVPPQRRAPLLVGLAAAAELALLLFALTPPRFNAVWLFCSGLPLGMIFGLLLRVLEGRQHTEALAAGLCASFIVADGVTKSAGAFLLSVGVPEFWMPFTAGMLFAPPLLVFIWMLARIPMPAAQDVDARSERVPVNRVERRHFLSRYGLGLTFLLVAYLSVTVLRSVRADFAPEIWGGLGVEAAPGVFFWSEAAVAIVVLFLSGSAILIRDSRRALAYGLALSVGGSALLAAALVGLRTGGLSPFGFMVLHGLGLYIPYIAVHTTVFERLLALTRDRGNIGYLMCLADGVGYLGYVIVLLVRIALGPVDSFLSTFIILSWVVVAASAATFSACWLVFANHSRARWAPATAPGASASV